jgi:ubiquinone/menaquinone biosynthesis C-methylase UbiE
MENSDVIKQAVKDEYSKRVENFNKSKNSSGSQGNPENNFKIVGDEYSKLDGYNPDADMGQGCGLPTQFAKIKEGDTVLDLGCGAGNDCFVARSVAGETGKIIGIDMTEAMINKAKENADKLGYKNMEFILGEIENMPIPSNTADVVVSNCVLNLVPDKKKAFSEIHRVLRPGGHFSISDMVLIGSLPKELRESIKLYAQCVAGAITKDEYLGIIYEQGFQNVILQKEEKVTIPDDQLPKFLTENEIKKLRNSEVKVFSITVY